MPIGILVLQNLLIFFRHYFLGYGFPWDFVGSYYAATAFWTEAAQHGGVPAWMPYQWLGYPFFLNMQTGLFYPLLWWFPILRIPYTLAAAVSFQCFHALIGAIGMYALLRIRICARREALIGAFAYQFFGGFYSNAEHVDIVRAYAFLPWLVAAATRRRSEETSLPRRFWLLPVVVYFLATGGYPGNLLAALFLVVVLLAAETLDQPRGALRRSATGHAIAAAVMIGCGLVMASIQLGPAFLFRDQLARYHGAAKIGMANLGFDHVPGLFLTAKWMPGDISMTSTYVGIVIVAAFFLLPPSRWRAHRPVAIVGVLAALMAAGSSFPIYRAVAWFLPPLGFSRFPSSDYRPWVAIAVITLAGAALQSLRHNRFAARRLAAGWMLFGLLFAWGMVSVYRPHASTRAIAAALASLAVSAAALLYWSRRPGMKRRLAAAALLGALALDGGRVLFESRDTWSVPNLLEYCRRYYPVPAALHDSGRVLDPLVLRGFPGPRPPRRETGEGNYPASGYLLGTYNTQDFGNLQFETGRQIESTPWMTRYMLREWLPVLLEPAVVHPTGPRAIEIRAPAKLPDGGREPRVRQTFYGLDRIRYEVDLKSPAWLIENEIDFPGWESRLSNGSVVTARRANGALRSWPLPAGRYQMEARFRLPGFATCAAVSAAAWIVFLLGASLGVAQARSVRIRALLSSFRPRLFPSGRAGPLALRRQSIVPVAALALFALGFWVWIRRSTGTSVPAPVQKSIRGASAAPAHLPFSDVSPNEPSAPFIAAAVELGAMRECQPGRFCPGAVVSRGAAAEAVVRILPAGAEVPFGPIVNFRDVSVGTSQARAIATLASRGAAAPCGTGLYCPDSPITRAALVRMILIARHGADFRPPAPSGLFHDLPPEDPQAGWVEAAARDGLAAGCGAGRFCPEAFVTRRQMAILIVAASTPDRSPPVPGATSARPR